MARILVVLKRSSYDRALARPSDKVIALLEQGDPTVANVRPAHDEHVETVAEVRQAIAELDTEATFVRWRQEPYDTSDYDLVVTVGGDGTLLHASHWVGDRPVLAINSAPSYSVGFFCGARKGGVRKALASALKDRLACAELTRMQVRVNGEIVHARVLNDALFCHQCPAASSRYIVERGKTVEQHKSSGIWIGPAAGSTAAQRSAGGRVLPLTSKALQLVVREPYTPSGERYRLDHAIIKNGQRLRVRAKDRNMRMYLDGPGSVLKVTVGDVIDFTQAPERLALLGISSRRKWIEG